MPDAFLTKFDRLLARATPGPWKMWNGWGPFKGDGLMRVERLGPEHEGGLDGSPDIRGSHADFDLIAHLVNHAALLRATVALAQDMRPLDVIRGDESGALRCPGCGQDCDDTLSFEWDLEIPCAGGESCEPDEDICCCQRDAEFGDIPHEDDCTLVAFRAALASAGEGE